MPLKLQPPRPGKTPNYSIRGTYYGVRVDRTAGTPERKKAQQVLNKIKEDIERGAYTPKGAVTFQRATLDYLRAGGDPTFLDPIVSRLGSKAAADIDQAEIDATADALYPNASNATRNRQVYTPISAVLKRAGIAFPIRRPKGADGRKKTDWMTQKQAERLLAGAEKKDLEFRIFLAVLLYTGVRLSEGLRLSCDDVHLDDALIFIEQTKNDDPRAAHAPPQLIAELANHPRGLDRAGEPLFRFAKNGHLYNMMKAAKLAAGLPQVSFHTCRHTWGTWMRRYAGLDTKGLVGTGAWRDEKSASRYEHVITSEEARRADFLPVLKQSKKA